MPILELVVAHYNENLNWLRNVPKELAVTVYDKSSDAVDERSVISLPNIGREAHTYLYHLVDRYDSLADWTVFCQGKPFDHAFDFKKSLRDFVTAPDSLSTHYPQGFGWLGHLIDTDDNQGDRLFRSWSKNEDGRGLDLLGFHRALFEADGPGQYTFVLGAQFVVHRSLVHQKPVSFYQHALNVSISFPDAAHCFERSWDRIFGVVGINSEWLAGRKTVYLKPMKHQSSTT
ncbi:DUF3431 domain-containing protein [Spirosoma sp.]|uniref:DUF3431 domain-containing protein n=1 Tax=Spirosoma sp. TaxID=1899569 RepID=UPI003B3B64B1